MAGPLGLHSVVKGQLCVHLGVIEKRLDRDFVAIFGPIVSGLEHRVRDAIEPIDTRRPKLAVVLDTPGGTVEVVERMVDTIRHFYDDVQFVIPDRAMSAGTIFAMSGDSIWMDYFSRLGPIDPQVWKDDKFVPALSYLNQYERLIEKDRKGELTSAEFALLSKFDLAELHQYEQARELSVSLLEKWLATYKFRNWTRTEGRGQPVTPEMKAERARNIASVLSDNQRWHSHGRGISRTTLGSDDVKLKIDALESDDELHTNVRAYHHCLRDYMENLKAFTFVHSRAYF